MSRAADSNPDYDALYEVRCFLARSLLFVCAIVARSPRRKAMMTSDVILTFLQFITGSPCSRPTVNSDKGCARCGILTSTFSTRAISIAPCSTCLTVPEGNCKPFCACGIHSCKVLFALHQLNRHAPPLVRAPVNSFGVLTCVVLPCGLLNALAPGSHASRATWRYRLRRDCGI